MFLLAMGLVKEEYMMYKRIAGNNYVLEAWQLLDNKDPARALAALKKWHIEMSAEYSIFYPVYYKYQAMILANMGDFEAAIASMLEYQQRHPLDEEAYAYLALYYQQVHELELAKEMNDKAQQLHPGRWPDKLRLPGGDSWRDVPIFINSYNRLNYLHRLIDWLLEAGYRRIYIIDNDSTYSPLLEYYQNIKKLPQITLVQLDGNLGYQALWNSGILRLLKIDTPYVYTDPDILPIKECPKDVVRYLFHILKKYSFLDKVGLGLKIDDITYWNKEEIVKENKQYYQMLLEDNIYFSPVDTTFALYRPVYSYRLFSAARVTGNKMARHLPWYLDINNLPEDEIYYMNTANESASEMKNYRAMMSVK